MAPESVAYNIFIAIRIRSNLNITALERACQQILDRHPILRTTYKARSGKPFQQIHSRQEVSLRVTDASNGSEDYLKEQIFLETDRPFNLEKEPVLRLNLFTRSGQEHILLLTMHHMAGDFWSFDLLLNELQVWYAVETKQVGPQQIEDFLPKNLPYTEFVHWQSEMLSSPRGEKLWEYWQKQLSGELPILNLPTDRPRPPVQNYRGETHIFQLDEQLIQGLRSVAISTETSIEKLMLAAFFVWLYRYTNQEDILLGSRMAGRWGREEFKGIVGYFVNPVVLRTDISGNKTFKDFLAQVSSQVKEAQNHQDYPFPLLVEKLQPQGDPSLSPLFQVSFTWQKQRWCESLKKSSRFQEPGLEMEPYPLGHQRGASVDLDVMVMEMGDVIQAGWQYNTDRFDEATIARMAGHFQTMLSGIVANPEQPISELPLLTETELHQLLVEWNNTSAEYPQDKCIHQLFEEQVERSPSSVAVVFEGEQLTYRELNAKANQLAHYLRELGVRPEVLVGLCVERSFEMIVGILGVLKAGAAYVPLDPAYPQDRLAFMLEDSSVPVLLTQSKLIEKLPPHSARVVCLDGDIKEIARHSQENPSSTVTPDNLAYVIYTSGSTGKPKGVLLAHCGLCNLATAQIQLFDVQPKSRVLQFASFSFDASVSEVFMAIVPGATLVLAKGDSLMPGPALIGLLRDCAITTVTLPPSVLAVLPAEEFPALQTIIVAGEACPPDVVARWEPGHQFFNAYGPTESTVCATVALCSDGSQKPLIGCPINNTKIYILDAQNQPVPIGVPGELHIAGVGLARGYLNRPELTEQKFIPSPFSDDPGIRLYKTGDLARYLPDGNVEYLGRIDNQVKIRGFRIELGEIDAVLTQHPDILSAAVIDREDTPGNKLLVAYVVSNLIPDRVPYHTECQLELDGNVITLHTEDISTGGVAVVGVPDIDEGRRVRLHLQLPGESFPRWLSGTVAWSRPPQAGIQFLLAPSEQALVDQSAAYQLDTLNLWKTLQRTLSGSLRDYLKQKLPDYMIPSAFVLMKALPLTPNGKVDRRALRAPDSFHKELEDKFVAPRTPTEVKLAAIWAEVLGVQEVGINDNFFELGGHSLIATQIISRIRQAFAIELPLRHLFEASTIASLGKVIETARKTESQEQSSYSTVSDSRLSLAPATRKGYIPLSKAQEHIWYVQQLNPDSCICNTRKALRFTGKLSSEALERSLNEIIRRHEIMRTTFPVVDGQPVQAIAPELTLPLKIVDLQNIPSAKREAKAVHFSQREMNYHFDLANGPLIKATLVRLSSEEHWLLIPIHHIITDGWSIDLFVQELETLYTAFSNGLPSPLPEVALHYADFTLWQRQCLNEEVLARQLDYWVQKLTAPLQLPEYRPERESKPNPKSGCASSYSLVLKENLVASLKYLSRSHRVTTSTIIIAGLILLLFKYHAQSEIMIVATIGNRSTPEIDKMLGCFINQVILRTHLDDEQTGVALLEQVQETLNEAISNKDIPLEQVIEAVKRQRKVTLYADVTIVPPVEISDRMFVSEIAPDSGSGELWDPEIPLEFYISSPSVDSQTIEFWFLYSTDLFASETIDRLFSYYQEILQKLADSPEMKIASFEGFPEKNREGAQ